MSQGAGQPAGPPVENQNNARQCDVVIATRNRPEPLRRCLEALAGQSVQGFGVIIVDDHSDEPLDEVVADVVARHHFDVEPVLLRLPQQSGPAAARNAGVAVTEATFVVFLDDDVVVDRHVLALHLSEVTSPGVSGLPVITRGPFVEPPQWDPSPWNLWEARMATKGTNAIVRGDYDISWRQFHTGNNCMPVDLFKAVGGFDETYKRMEDDEFGLRVWQHGCEIRFIPAALAYHHPSRSLESWLAVPRSYGYYEVRLDRQYPHLNHLVSRRRDLAASHPLLRAVRRLAGGRRRTDLLVAVTVAAAKLTHRAGLSSISIPALSLAFDLMFADGMRAAEAEFAAQRNPRT